MVAADGGPRLNGTISVENERNQAWRVYVVRCGDGTFYTGIAKDVARRLAQHEAGQGARYTRGRGPIRLWWRSAAMSKSEALSLEHRLKGLTHRQKVALKDGDGDQGLRRDAEDR